MKHKTKIILMTLVGLLMINGQSCKKMEAVQNNLLESSLNLLGEKLFSLLGDGESKEMLREKYAAFVQRAVLGEADQGQIETVAANILNASNSRDSIPEELAESIVGTTEEVPDRADSKSSSTREALSPDQRSAIGENLKDILKLNEAIREKYTGADLGSKVYYKYDRGLVLNIDEDLKQYMSDEEFVGYVQGMKEANKALRMEWKDDLEKQLQAERKALAAEMKKLRDMDWSKYASQSGKKWMNYAAIDSNFIPVQVPEVNLDSIFEEVQQKLREAGIRDH